ncbi:uncharacterized protein LOC134261922, partial [Saccostrea cucullata]|uniref:uncharacterized protein LOC134261922 n=1 Tax=Saccostrea cuccullata TaxID=36930 RepID=UPI002ED673EC
YVGGSHYTDPGTAVDPFCLPRNPEWERYKDKVETWRGYVYGSEYETHDGHFAKLYNHNVQCAVCLLKDKPTTAVFPARKSCYRGWRLEYKGYLMSGYHGFKAGTMYTCIDKHPDTVAGGHATIMATSSIQWSLDVGR